MKKILFSLILLLSFQLYSNDLVQTISVTGTGIINIKPDSVILNTGVNSSDPDVGKAIDNNNTTMNKVLKKLKELEIKEEYVQTSNYNVHFYKPYKSILNEKEEYRVSNNIRITIKNVDILSSVINNLVKIGVTQINGINFEVNNINQYSDKLSLLALQDARNKALVLAEAENLKIISILSITEKGSNSYDPFLKRGATLAFASEGDVAISNGSEDITKSYNVIYQVVTK